VQARITMNISIISKVAIIICLVSNSAGLSGIAMRNPEQKEAHGPRFQVIHAHNGQPVIIAAEAGIGNIRNLTIDNQRKLWPIAPKIIQKAIRQTRTHQAVPRTSYQREK